MNKENSLEKEVGHGLKETVVAQIVGNAIVFAIVMVLSVLLVFFVLSPKYDMATVLGFFACTIPFFTIIQLFMPVYTARVDHMHGKVDLSKEETGPVSPLLTCGNGCFPGHFFTVLL